MYMCLRERGGGEERRRGTATGFYMVLEAKKICGLGSVTRVCEYGTPERGGSVYIYMQRCYTPHTPSIDDWYFQIASYRTGSFMML